MPIIGGRTRRALLLLLGALLAALSGLLVLWVLSLLAGWPGTF
jgi:hypothetical protein